MSKDKEPRRRRGAANFRNVVFEGNDTGIVADSSVSLDFDGARFSNNGTGIVHGDRAILIGLGLPLNTPPGLLVELLEHISALDARAGKQQREAVVHRSRLWDWLQNAANAATVGSMLMSVVGNPQFHPHIGAYLTSARRLLSGG